ncbi:MAG: hypothetical protein HY775_02430 [Acidobacteria bacterium]|nr:hypothetical protein [Acidobacteriota bacterium]
MRGISFRARAMALVGLCVLLVGTALVLIESGRIRELILSERAAQVARVARHVEEGATKAYLSGGREAALAFLRQEAVHEVLSLGAEKVIITDGARKILAHSDPALVGRIYSGEEVAEVLESGRPVTGAETASEFAFAVPLAIPGGPPGAFEAEVDIPALYSTIATVRRQALLASLIVLTVALPLTSWSANRLLGRVYDRERRASERLREAERLKSDLVAAVSHEFRTPLAAIIGYLRTLLRSGLDATAEERAAFLDSAERQAGRLERLVETLLATAGIERAGRVSPEPVDLAELGEDLRREFSARAPAHRFELALPAGLPQLATEREKVHLILANLLDNAIKFSPPGSTVSLAAEARPGEIRLAIADEGPGIAPEKLRTLFRPFAQLDSSATRKAGGLGKAPG